MSNEWDGPASKPTTPKRRRRWLHWLLWTAGALLLLLIVTYFVATSAWLLKRAILPRVSTAMNATVTVQDASISPFSAVTLRGLKVQTQPQTEALVSIAELSTRYSLMDIIGGHINVAEVTITDPVVVLVENADGTSNLDPILKRPQAEPPAQQPTESAPPQIALGKLQINNATVRHVKRLANGREQVAELANVNVTLANVGNGQAGSLNLSTDATYDEKASAALAGTNTVRGDLSTALNFALTPELKPQSLSGDVTLNVTQLPAALRDYNGLGISLHCDATPTDLEQLLIVVKQRAKTLAKVSARGPFDLAKQEGRLRLELSGVDTNVLGIAGAKLGIDFGGTTLSCSNDIVLADGARTIAVTGRLLLSQLSAARAGAVTPVMNLQVDYAAGLNRAENTAELKKFAMVATQNAVPFLEGSLTRPTKIALAGSSNAVAESSFHLGVTNLNVADWKALVGDYAGLVNLNLELAMKNAGRQLEIQLTTDLTKVSAPLGSNRVTDAAVALSAKATLDQFTKAHISDFACTVSHRGAKCVGVAASGDYDLGSQEADVQLQAEAGLPQAMGIVAVPGVTIPAGSVTVRTHLVQTRLGTNVLRQAATGTLRLKDANITAPGMALNRLDAGLDWDVVLSSNLLHITKFLGEFQRGGQPAGTLETSGDINLTNNVAALALGLKGVNENLLAPLAGNSLGDKTLKSLTVNLNANAKYSPAAESTIAGTIQLENLLVEDPKQQLPKTPLAVDLKLDAGLRSNLVVIRDLAAKVRFAQTLGCDLAASGDFDIAQKAGHLKLKLADLNENAIRPFAATALGDKVLKSVTITAELAAAYNPNGHSTVQGQLGIKNLAVVDPSGALPPDALSLGVQVDAALAKNVSTIRNLQLQLSPTARAKNSLSMTGRVDFSRSNALDGDVLIASEALDVTPYYDMFVGRSKNTPATGTTNAAPATPQPKTPPEEPAAVTLPIQHFGLALDLNRFFLREVAIRDWKTRVSAEGSRINLRTLEMVLNGAAIKANADVNLGVPGYDYVLGFTSERIPLDPFVNSFAPELRGKAKGEVVADLQARGAGVTGRSLQKSLAGQFGLQLTNCTVAMTNPKVRTFLYPISFLLGTPELLNSALNGLWTSGRMGQGKIAVQQLVVASDTFTASTFGEIPIAEVVGNSPLEGWPVRFSLQRTLAERVRLSTPSTASSGSPYVDLPDFIRVGGTVSDPQALLNKKALTSIAVGKLKDSLLQSSPLQQPTTPSFPSTPSVPSTPSLSLPIFH